VYRRLAERGLYARRLEVCVPLTQFHKRARLSWSPEHQSWTEQDWLHVLFSNESRFSAQSNPRRVFIWKDPGARCHPEASEKSIRFCGTGILVWDGIMLDGRTPLHIFSTGTMTTERYRDEILESYVRLFEELLETNSFLWTIMPYHAQLSTPHT